MPWSIFDNPIATMRGPYFLAFYAVFIVVVMWFVKRRIFQHRQTEYFVPHPLPKKPDPYYIAWLQGDKEAVTRLAVMRLLHDGVLEKTDGNRLISVGNTTLPSDHRPPEAALWEYFGVDRSAEFASRCMIEICLKYQAQAKKEGLLADREEPVAIRNIIRNGRYAIVTLGIYKLISAFVNGHSNVGFLILMMIAGLIIYQIKCARASSGSKLSEKGEDYIERLKSTLPQDEKTLSELNAAMLGFALFGAGMLASNAIAAELTATNSLFPGTKMGGGLGAGSGGGSGCSGGGSSCSGSSCSGGGGCGGCGGGGGD